MMKSKYLWVGGTSAVLLVAACDASVIDPIGGGPGGRAGQSGESSAGSGGESSESAGRGGELGASAGRGGESDAAPAGAAGQAGEGDAGRAGNAGEASCDALRLLAKDAIRSSRNRDCEQDSDCEQFSAPCLFPYLESCGNLFGVSKAAHAQVSAAYDGYAACVGSCNFGNACAPTKIAQCSQGQCLDTPHPGAACASISSQAAVAVEGQETCTVVVRVDSVSLAVVGHVLVCGPRNVVDEAAARASANASPKVDGFDIGTGDLLSGSTPSDVWLFHEIIGDFGHISAVSAVNGATVFWGSLLWAGTMTGPTVAGVRVGAPQAPTAWGTTEIGSGCYPSPAVARRDWEIRVGPNATPTATPAQAAERVLWSALLHGVSANLPLTNVVTLHYGVSVSTTHPISEYIVIVNAAKAP